MNITKNTDPNSEDLILKLSSTKSNVDVHSMNTNEHGINNNNNNERIELNPKINNNNKESSLNDTYIVNKEINININKIRKDKKKWFQPVNDELMNMKILKIYEFVIKIPKNANSISAK